MNILAFGASSSAFSINKQLAHYTATYIQNKHPEEIELLLLDLNDFEMPIYSIDKEEKDGMPQYAKQFSQYISNADGIIVSFAEHNGSYSTAFKNILDRCSRLEGSVWQDTPMFVMSTSPGGRGGQSVLEAAMNRIPRNGGTVIAHFSLPLFEEYFSSDEGITDPVLRKEWNENIDIFVHAL